MRLSRDQITKYFTKYGGLEQEQNGDTTFNCIVKSRVYQSLLKIYPESRDGTNNGRHDVHLVAQDEGIPSLFIEN